LIEAASGGGVRTSAILPNTCVWSPPRATPPTASCSRCAAVVDADPVESVAQRTCVACGTSAFIADSDEHWSEARPERWHCECQNDAAELGVAFSLRSDGEVRWITVGQRCTRCGLLDAVVDWKIDYGPSTHLLAQV
jgi:hypothetical protein